MSSTPALKKSPSLHQLLETKKSVVIKISSNDHFLNVPDHVKNKKDYFFIKIGNSKDVFTPGLKILPHGFLCKLVFLGVPSDCFIPWSAVEGYSGEAVKEYEAISRRKEMALIDCGGICDRVVERKLTLVKNISL